MATTNEAEGIKVWPTDERFQEAEKALAVAYDALERLEMEFLVLSGSYDPADIAHESAPMPAEAIGATVSFVENVAAVEIDQFVEMLETMRKWPAMMADVRGYQMRESSAAA